MPTEDENLDDTRICDLILLEAFRLAFKADDGVLTSKEANEALGQYAGDLVKRRLAACDPGSLAERLDEHFQGPF